MTISSDGKPSFEHIPCTQLSQRDQRSLVFHLLYAVESFDYATSLEAVAENFSREYGYIILGGDQVFISANAVIMRRDELDKEMLPFLANWRFDRLSVATRLILRYALWELKEGVIPTSVIINEAIELAKCFAEKDAYRFVNGILDEWAKAHRAESNPSPEQSSDQQS